MENLSEDPIHEEKQQEEKTGQKEQREEIESR
jgi:hypothetical protein